LERLAHGLHVFAAHHRHRDQRGRAGRRQGFRTGRHRLHRKRRKLVRLEFRHAAQFRRLGARQERHAQQCAVRRQRERHPALEAFEVRLERGGRQPGFGAFGRRFRLALAGDFPRLLGAAQHRPFQTVLPPTNAGDPRRGHA